MRKLILFLLLFIFLFSGLSFAAEYEITKVINIGPAGGPSLGPLKWSPDGTRLSYFRDNSLYISDTLGNSQKITDLDMPPDRYEWLSNQELVIYLRQFLGGPRVNNRLIKVNVNNSEIEILEEYNQKPGANEIEYQKSFQGPRKTANGQIYYRKNTDRYPQMNRMNDSRISPIKIIESNYSTRNVEQKSKDDFVLIWGKDGVYKLHNDLSDSVQIASKKKHPIRYPIILSPDKKRYMIGDKICELDGDTCVEIFEQIRGNFSESCGLGIWHYSFNSTTNEVILDLHCEKNVDTHSYEYDYYICTFNYDSNIFTVIDHIIDLEDCMYPALSFDGQKIAFICDGDGYILYRRMQNE